VDGEPDLRCSDQRRGDALVCLVRRAVAAAPGAGTAAGSKAQLVVTVDYGQLRDGLGAGTTLGGLDAGTILAPQTVRRIACDAALLPAVLGGDGEVLDWGHTRRLFTPGQVKRLWLRDGGCTWPQCGIPAAWTDAHHLIHWADGGPTDLDNAALLCDRHHTLVHQRRHAGTLTTTADPDTGRVTQTVQWDRTRGSYDTLLAARQARRRA
jgi:hypothetical protein